MHACLTAAVINHRLADYWRNVLVWADSPVYLRTVGLNSGVGWTSNEEQTAHIHTLLKQRSTRDQFSECRTCLVLAQKVAVKSWIHYRCPANDRNSCWKNFWSCFCGKTYFARCPSVCSVCCKLFIFRSSIYWYDDVTGQIPDAEFRTVTLLFKIWIIFLQMWKKNVHIWTSMICLNWKCTVYRELQWNQNAWVVFQK